MFMSFLMNEDHPVGHSSLKLLSSDMLVEISNANNNENNENEILRKGLLFFLKIGE